MHVPFFDLSRQQGMVQDAVETAALRVLRHGRFILGEEVSTFEDRFAAYCSGTGKPVYAVGVSSGTDALLLVMMALGVGPGTEVIVPNFTFVSPLGCVARLGATPVFVDINETFGMDPYALERAINPKTRAIVPVHLFGQMADIGAIMRIADAYQVPVIEDAAQAIGARYNGQHAGTFGLAGCFSFFPTKNLGGAGDSGMVITADEAFAETLRMLRVHGASKRYIHEAPGGNFRMDALQAAILDAKLDYLPEWIAQRAQHAEAYLQAWSGLKTIDLPEVRPQNTHTWHQFTLQVATRDRFIEHLAVNGVESQIYYPRTLTRQPFVLERGWQSGVMPRSERASHEVVQLPVSHLLTQSEREHVIDVVNRWQ